MKDFRIFKLKHLKGDKMTFKVGIIGHFVLLMNVYNWIII